MASSTLDSLFSLFNKFQSLLSSGPSSSCPPVVPKLKKLNDMVYEVWSPLPKQKPTLEIIFFHGLQQRYSTEAYFTTWMSNDNSHLWLQTWLVEAFPKARILTISYDASLKSTHETGNLDMYRTSENLVSSLTGSDVQVGQAGCPVVLVGHCLGGLVLKQLCLDAAYMLSRNKDDVFGVGPVSDFLSNVRGMFFYGTPQTGSLLGDKLPKHVRSALAEEFETLRATSMRRNEEFRQLKSRYNWLSYGIGEQDMTFLDCLGKSIFVVLEASARPYMDRYCSIGGDHFTICKPSGKNTSGFSFLANFLQQIQEDGELQVIYNVESHPEYYMDLKGRASQVTKILAQPNVHTTFILGLSGIGKSALAQRVFYNLQHKFAVACFVSFDTIDTSSNCKKHILDKIQACLKELNVSSIDNHFSLLRYLRRKRVLMVADNVKSEDQLKALETRTWLEGTGSKLIVTTTNYRLGMTSNEFQAHFEVPYLNDEESHQLFSKYAFENQDAPRHLKPLIKNVIERCANFPLALKILGSYASTENIHNPRLWQELIGRMDKAVDVDSGPSYRLWATLRVCFNALGLIEQELFLDVATFFHGFPFSMVECIWAASWEFPFTAWSNLTKLFLANVDEDGNIWMHSQLRVLGQNISCDGNITLDKWRRIYQTKDSMDLIEKYQGIVHAIGLNLHKERRQRLFLGGRTFIPYVQLRYLMLKGVETTLENLKLPTSLVYLKWTDSLFEVCPVDFSHLKNLVVLDLTDCSAMKALPLGLKNVRNLTWLELRGCVSLANPLGMVSKFSHLKHLGLSNIGLSAISEAQLTQGAKQVCSLLMLMSLDLSYTGLTALPEAISSLQLLRTLSVEGTKLISLPESIGELRLLETLNVGCTPLKTLPESIGNLRKLKDFQVHQTNLRRLPDTIGDLSELEVLIVVHTKVKEMPRTFNKLLGLQEYEGRASFVDNSLQHLLSLESLHTLTLDLRDFGEQSPMAMTDPQGQVQVQYFGLPSFSFTTLFQLTLHGRHFAQSSLAELFCALQKIPSLQRLYLEEFNAVKIMPHELGALTNLEFLVLCDFVTLEELPESLSNLSRLTGLNLYGLPRLSKLPESLVALTSLSYLVIIACESLQSMPSSFGHKSTSQPECSTLQFSNLYGTPSSSELPWLGTTSWRLLECFSECCGGQTFYLYVSCDQMEKIMQKITRNRETEADFDVVDTETFLELIGELKLDRQGQENALHESLGSSTSHTPSGDCTKFQELWIYCITEQCLNFHGARPKKCAEIVCNAHRVPVRIMDIEKESDTEEEEEEEESRPKKKKLGEDKADARTADNL